MAGDHGMINPNAFKRRLLRAAVQENVKVMEGSWPRLHCPQPSSRPTWFSLSVGMAVVFALAPLLYVAATVANAPRDVVQVSPSAMAETRLDLVSQAPASLAITSPMPVSTDLIESSILDSASMVDIRSEMLSEVEPASTDADLLFPEPRPLDVRALALVAKRIVIDPGHGGDDPGTVTAHGLTEKEITLDIGLRLRALLTASSFEVRMTPRKR